MIWPFIKADTDLDQAASTLNPFIAAALSGLEFTDPDAWRLSYEGGVPSLELHGWGEVGRHLRRLTREGRWQEMKGAITDEMLDQLVPLGSYGEIADVLRQWYGDLVTALAFPMPEDPSYDTQAAAVIVPSIELQSSVTVEPEPVLVFQNDELAFFGETEFSGPLTLSVS